MASHGRVHIVLMLSVLVVAPLASAAWGVKGTLEPDTRNDRIDGKMFANPDQTAGGRKVYFNGFQGQELAPGTWTSSLSPNVAAAGTSVPASPYRAWAMMGVWKDCNKDGYVGFADQGLWEYRVDLLSVAGGPGASVCPSQGPLPWYFQYIDNRGWQPVHNDGQWVHEWLAIGYDDWAHNEPGRTLDNNPWNLNDSEARVWMDFGKPGDDAATLCSIDPIPRGTVHNVGQMVDYTDCFAPIGIDENASTTLGSATWTTVRATRNPWGEESDASYASAWDCGREPVATTQDPTWDGDSGITHQYVEYPPVEGVASGKRWQNASNSNGYVGGYWNISATRTPTANAAGSPAGTLNETESGTDECDRRTDGDNNARSVFAGTSNSNYPYEQIEDDARVTIERKRVTDAVMFFIEGSRTGHPGTVVLGKGTPPDYGLRPTGQETGPDCYDCDSGFWMGDWEEATNNGATRNPFLARDSIGPAPVTYATYYGFVGSAAISALGLTLPGIAGGYGAESCAQTGTAWECDANLWWPNGIPRLDPGVVPDPSDPTLGRELGVRAGQAYQLRDVDCFDESVTALRQQGITWGTLTSTRCL